MGKRLILITGSVTNSDPKLTATFNELVSFTDTERFDVLSPLDTMRFTGTDSERYERSLQILDQTSLMIAEMSRASTGQGMEVQQAASLGIPILVIAKKESKISGLIKGCPAVEDIIYYNDVREVKDEINKFITYHLL